MEFEISKKGDDIALKVIGKGSTNNVKLRLTKN